MATVNKALGSGGALPANLRAVEVMARNFDFSTANGANGDIRHLMLIPAGTLVKVIFAENELQAENLLNQVREGEPLTGDDW